MTDEVRIAAAAADAILAHARAEAPRECCGLLVGQGRLIEQACPARNAAEAPATRFLIDPRDHFTAIRSARTGGRVVLGYYHSHPAGAPVPSPTDLAEAGEPDAIHLIVGGGPDGPLTLVRAFRLQGSTVADELALVRAG